MAHVLFVCVQNAGRSQMAQAFLERAAGAHAARSAGTAPAARVHTEVAAAMQEIGIDIADRVPMRLERADAEWADVVVTMGCGDACPVVPGVRYVDWELDDPRGMDLDGVRRVREVIRSRVEELVAEL